MTKGFSIIELLLVLAIIGIVGGVGAVNLIRAIDRARVGEVASQLAADLERARSSTWRSNQSSTLTWLNRSSYRLTIDGRSFTRTIPAEITVTLPAITTLTYRTPYGEIDTNSNLNFTIARTNKSVVSESIKVLGITGKVYRQ